METIDICEVFEENSQRDFVFYDCGLLHKNISQFLDEETELFLLVNDDLYKKYKNDDFVISLDNIWNFLGYNQKSRAKRTLESQFVLNKDYKIFIIS